MIPEYYAIDFLVCARTADAMKARGYALGHCDDCRTGIWINSEEMGLAPHLGKLCLYCARARLEPDDVIGVAPSIASFRKDHAETYAQGQR